MRIYGNLEKKKGEIARDEQFLLFPSKFFIVSVNVPPFFPHLKLLSANSFNLTQFKICRLIVDTFPSTLGAEKHRIVIK